MEAGGGRQPRRVLRAPHRARLAPDEVADAYVGVGSPELGEPGRDGDERLVPVTWDDGSTSTFTVIGQDGLRVCGVD